MGEELLGLHESSVLLICWFVLGMALTLGVPLACGWWFLLERGTKSPFGNEPLLSGDKITFNGIARIREELFRLPQPYNPSFDPLKSAVCSETGRVFPNAVTRFGRISLRRQWWQQQWSGEWVAWEDLTPPEQERVARMLDLTDYPLSEPKACFVDPFQGLFKGWRRVPGCDLQMMVTQPIARTK